MHSGTASLEMLNLCDAFSWERGILLPQQNGRAVAFPEMSCLLAVLTTRVRYLFMLLTFVDDCLLAPPIPCLASC